MSAIPVGSTLHARLIRTQDGMVRAEYPGEFNSQPADASEFPDLHLGTDEHEVRTWVEQMAKDLGYASVVWE